MSAPVRILIVDDHEVVRKGLTFTVGQLSWAHICGEAHTGHQAVVLARELQPDLIIMDFSLPDYSGLEVTRAIKKFLPATKILIFSMDVPIFDLKQLESLGINGCVFKADSTAELLQALETIRQGGEHLPARRSAAGDSSEDAFARLTPRELEITALLAQGQSNKEGAHHLGISIKTVETHRARIMRKLRLKNFAELVQLAMRHGLIKM